MLHSFAFKNFQSFADWTEVSMLQPAKTSRHGWQRTASTGERLSTAMAVFGANAAGKTALLKPLAFIHWFLSDSFNAPADSPIPVTPHEAFSEEPVEFEVIVDDSNGELLKYALRATQDRVLHESVYRKKPSGRYSYVFIRDWNESTSSYDIKQQSFGMSPAEAKKVRANASLIATGVQYGVEAAEILAGFNLSTNITIAGRQRFQRTWLESANEYFFEHEDLRTKMVSLLTHWDLGLSDIVVQQFDIPQSNGKTRKTTVSIGQHKSKNGRAFALPMELESSGTQSAYVLLSYLLWILDAGGVALMDEMESDLHPHLIPHILDLFANESTNPNGAQLIFTSLSQDVLGLLQKSQVMFVEKSECESQAYRGDDIQGLRADDNLRAKYDAGALGAVPRV